MKIGVAPGRQINYAGTLHGPGEVFDVSKEDHELAERWIAEGWATEISARSAPRKEPGPQKSRGKPRP